MRDAIEEGMNATTDTNELRIDGINYAVTATNTDRGIKYELHGPRGARLFTMRNYHNPSLMFLINGRTQKTTNIWLTDKSGTLERVEVL